MPSLRVPSAPTEGERGADGGRKGAPLEQSEGRRGHRELFSLTAPKRGFRVVCLLLISPFQGEKHLNIPEPGLRNASLRVCGEISNGRFHMNSSHFSALQPFHFAPYCCTLPL